MSSSDENWCARFGVWSSHLRGHRRRRGIAALGALLIGGLSAAQPAAGTNIVAGEDLWTTPCGATYDYAVIPPDFFDPGSDPFSPISLMGSQLLTNQVPFLGPVDTIVRRKLDANPTCAPPGEVTIPIEIVALSLVSCSPITVTYVASPAETWDVDVCLDVAGGAQSDGSMTIRHECFNGGTYTATLPVRAELTFTRIVPNDGAQRTIVHQVNLASSGWWSHDNGFFLLTINPGTTVDSDCDGFLVAPPDMVSIGSTPAPEGFFPGLYSLDCTSCTAPGSFKKPMTDEQERWASHGVYVANEDKPRPGTGQLVGACCAGSPNPPNTCVVVDCTSCLNTWNGSCKPPGTTCSPNPCIPGNPVCGDGTCLPPIENQCTCPLDCGASPANEAGLCANGIDDDCDGAIDCADTADCATDPACAPPALCPLPPLNPWCTSRQSLDCLVDDPSDFVCLVEATRFDAAGGPDVQKCACFTDNPDCGPVEIVQVPGGTFDVRCPGPCPPGQNCYLHFDDGTGTGPVSQGTNFWTDTSTIPPGVVVTCDCVVKPPTYKNWVIADDFMVGCTQCTCDLNRDGIGCPAAGGACDQADIDFLNQCIAAPEPKPPQCRNADLECDGDVDGFDGGVLSCLCQGYGSDVCCPNPRPRPEINKLRWYGSYLDPAFDPNLGGTRNPDGWYIALHSDLPPAACPLKTDPSLKTVDLCGTLRPGVECCMFKPKGSSFEYSILYSDLPAGTCVAGTEVRICGHIDTGPSFCMQGIGRIAVNAVMDCDTAVSRPDRLIAQWAFNDILADKAFKDGCDGLPIYSYTVDLTKGCLVHNNAGLDEIPDPNGPFFPRNGRTYWLSIQAEVGATWVKSAPGECTESKTGQTITQPFWGWHTTPPGYQQKDDAYMGQIAMGCAGEWVYEWTMGHLHCSDPRFRDCCDDPTKSIDMAFCLLETHRVCAGTNVPCNVNADCAGTVCMDVDATWWCQPVNGGGGGGSGDPPPIPRPFPVGGIDELASTQAFVVVNIDDDGDPNTPPVSRDLFMQGPTVVARTGGPDQVQPQPEPPRPLPSTIETEMLMLELRSSVDGTILRLNPDAPRSMGQTTAGAGGGVNPYPADSFFDVFVDIELPALVPTVGGRCFSGPDDHPVVCNEVICHSDAECPTGCTCRYILISGNAEGTGPGPVRLDAQIHEVPPGQTAYLFSGEVPLLRKGSLEQVGSIQFVGHNPPYRGGIDIHSDTDWVGIPTVPCCEPDRTNTDTYCSKSTCPNPDEKCYPTAIAYDALGPYALDCACQKADKCRLTVPEDIILPICVNSCPDSMQQCLTVGDGTAANPYKCVCDQAPACEPNAAGTACTACPNPAQKCIPKKVKCIPGTTICSVAECECVDADICHVDLNAAGLPYCVNKCPDDPVNPLTCELRGTDTDGDGVNDLFDCFCDPPPPACEPNSLGTGCNPVVCPAADEKCKPKCVIFNPMTGKITLDTCDCLGPTECHMQTTTASGGNVANVAGVGATGDPCVVVDDGSGTVQLPPVGCEYLSPDEVHKIVDGLPAGTTIELAAIHKDFICNRQGTVNPVCTFPTPTLDGDCDEDGGSLGGEKECAGSKLQLSMQGTDTLNTFSRMITLDVSFETHTAPRMPGDSQSFDTDMFRLGGQLPPGDPDFDLLRITAGTDYGMPSPGHTTLTKMGGNWAVDSFFDIEYRIDFVGAPGGPLDGRSGSTTGTIRMQTTAFKCVGDCPPNTTCVEKRTVQADLTVKACCECEPIPCQPNAAGTGCAPTVCPDPTQECVPQAVSCGAGNLNCAVTLCECRDPDVCHVDLNAAGLPYCVNKCPDDPTNPLTCELRGMDTDGDGVNDLFDCFCDPPPPACEPNSLKTDCNPVTCPDTGTGVVDKCQKKCVILDPLTGAVTLSDCACVGPNDCHMELHPAAGGAAAGGVADAGAGGSGDCVVVDDGSGTVKLPPDGCDYLSPDEFHKIVDGLPAGVTIEIAAIHKDFICNRQTQPDGICDPPINDLVDCTEAGGSLGGDRECADSTLELHMRGTGALGGSNTAGPSTYVRTILLPVRFETHTGPRTPGDPVQSFDTDMFRLQGGLPPGDPDFDLLQIRAGTGFGMPSPGHTTLRQMGGPGGPWSVDSFFDIEYRIEFTGAPGSPFSGMSGSTTATIRMATKPFKCVGNCPAGTVCNETRTPQADGTIKVCCECEPEVPQACEPLPDGSACTDFNCGCFGECTSFGGYCDNANCCIDPNNCMCYDKNAQESIKRCGDCFGECIGGSYCESALPGCSVVPGAPVCYVPNHHYSIYLCGDCFGSCVNGSYCDDPAKPDCCVNGPTSCACYAPTHPVSIKMCDGLEQCKPKCVKYNQLTGQVTVTRCDCIGDECYVKVGNPVVTAGPGASCEVADNGSGSVDLPPAGCEYLTADEVHKIIDGLPAGTEIHLAPIHKDFICRKGQQGVCSFLDVDCKEDGGDLGGEKECSDSTLEFQLTGTGTLAGWNRIVTIPNVSFETHIGKKKPFEPVQSFPTEMFKLQGVFDGAAIGDPDFDLLRITAGSGFGMPSPGHTTLTRLPNGNWAVDSFFDITYEIEFRGTGPRLGGMSGSTTATIRMATPTKFKCSTNCPPGMVCKQTATQLKSCVGGTNPGTPCPLGTECLGGGTCNPDGTMSVCCDCVDAAACEPKPDKKSCTNNTCPPGVVCKPKRIQCFPAPRGCEIVECECLDGDPCHVEMPPQGAIEPVCAGACPVPPPNNRCNLKKVPLPGGGMEYSCACGVPGGVVVWNDDLLSPERTTRSLRFRVSAPVTATATPGQDAIKVTMIDLQNPIPANLPQFPPPDFSAYESATCTAAGEANGCARWVGKPGTFLESQDNPDGAANRAARLQCTPFYYDWVTETASGPIAVVGGEIAPSSEYSVQTYGASCKGAEDLCPDVGAPVTMYTRRSGDVEQPFNPPTNVTQPDVTDIAQLVNKFKNVPGAPVKAISQLQPNLPELNADINALDIVAVVDAVKQFAYPFGGPCPCPSVVPCGPAVGSVACTTSPTPCVTAFGTGSLCVKTCSGGVNAGDPCINNTHCPDGSCGAGFCRDRCGRCSP